MSKRAAGTTGIAREVAGRRAVLAGLGVVGAGALAACSSSGSSASSTTSASPSASTAPAPAATSAAPASTSAAPVTSAAPSSAPAATSAPASSSAAATSTAAAPAGFSVAESEIPVGGGKYFSSDAVIITQPTAGAFKAFTSVCTHQGCPVTQITGGLMICPCHGSEYSIKDGSVVKGPAVKALAAEPFTLAGGKVIVAKS